MDRLTHLYDPVGNTLTIYFGDPKREHICEETADEIVLMKDDQGEVIGIEILHFSQRASEQLRHLTEPVAA